MTSRNEPTRRPTLALRPALASAIVAATLLPWQIELAEWVGPAGSFVLLLVAIGVAAGLATLWPHLRPPPSPAPQTEPASTGERERAIVATITEGLVTIDRRGIIDGVNQAAERMFGYTAPELLGRNVAMLMPQPYAVEHDSYLARYLQSGQARIIGIGREVSGKRKDGSTFPIDLSVGEGSAGGERFFVAIIRDITERKEIQAKLAQSERLAAVGELAAGVAHEVNNPINTVINCAQLILDGDDPADNAAIVREEGERIATIVKDLLQFARNDDSLPVPTAIAETVQRTLRLMGENLTRHGIELTISVPEDLPPVHARPQQLQQVLLNLLINAKDALQQEPLPQRRAVHLAAATSGQGVEIIVADTGPGVPTAMLDRIFEPFVTTKRARGGTGLGLSISKSIIEGYGGTLTVQNVPNSGARFRAWLPIHPDAEG
jgi:two-component system sensor kinase FixL